jgi:hypothetical protein
MDTYEAQAAFFREQWPALKAAIEAGGAGAGIDFIRAFDDPLQRRVLFAFARQGLNGRDGGFEDAIEPPSFDNLIAVADAGIAELLAQAEAEADAALRDRRVDSANVISYNLGADLADSWGDGRERTDAHFRRGLQAGEDCIRWRTQLGKPPAAMAMAYWVRGMHRLSLGDGPGAKEDFAASVASYEEDAAAEGRPIGLVPEAGFGIVLGHGYVAIAEHACGEAGAGDRYRAALACFERQKSGADAEAAADAAFGITQLEAVWAKYATAA